MIALKLRFNFYQDSPLYALPRRVPVYSIFLHQIGVSPLLWKWFCCLNTQHLAYKRRFTFAIANSVESVVCVSSMLRQNSQNEAKFCFSFVKLLYVSQTMWSFVNNGNTGSGFDYLGCRTHKYLRRCYKRVQIQLQGSLFA